MLHTLPRPVTRPTVLHAVRSLRRPVPVVRYTCTTLLEVKKFDHLFLVLPSNKGSMAAGASRNWQYEDAKVIFHFLQKNLTRFVERSHLVRSESGL